MNKLDDFVQNPVFTNIEDASIERGTTESVCTMRCGRKESNYLAVPQVIHGGEDGT